jgi:hypothetical protein
MKFTRLAVSTLIGTATMLAATAIPAQAAYPVTDFPQITAPFGAGDVDATWYNRSVGISGAVSDHTTDDFTTQICAYGYATTNAIGDWLDYECRGADGRTRTFAFDLDGGNVVGGIQSVRVVLKRQSSQGLVAYDWRTRNRPAA